MLSASVENGEGIQWLVSLTEKDAFKNRLDLLTANRIVNAVMPVCEADPGIIHPLDLPNNLGSSQIKR